MANFCQTWLFTGLLKEKLVCRRGQLCLARETGWLMKKFLKHFPSEI
jgi:hypothetical protein